MAKDFTQMSDAELGKCFRSRYDRLCDAHDMGLDDGPHPSERWASDTEILHAHRDAKDAAKDENSGLGPKTIQKRGTPSEEQGLDDQPESSATPGPNAGKKPAMDGIFEIGMDGLARFTTAKGQVLVGDAAIVARAGQSNPGRVRRVASAIKGYDRLR